MRTLLCEVQVLLRYPRLRRCAYTVARIQNDRFRGRLTRPSKPRRFTAKHILVWKGTTVTRVCLKTFLLMNFPSETPVKACVREPGAFHFFAENTGRVAVKRHLDRKRRTCDSVERLSATKLPYSLHVKIYPESRV